jgi:pantetheine-phosphate adenylyltransferase
LRSSGYSENQIKHDMAWVETRKVMAEQAMAKFENVSVQSYSGLVRDFVVQSGAKAMVRGLRAVTDFDYEFQLAGMNRRLMPDVETVFLTPGDQYQFISSSFVREIALLGGKVDEFVAPHVWQQLQQKIRQRADNKK